MVLTDRTDWWVELATNSIPLTCCGPGQQRKTWPAAMEDIGPGQQRRETNAPTAHLSNSTEFFHTQQK